MKNKTATAHIYATYNNTIISITDDQGNVLCSSSAGEKFKGSRKSTPYAAQLTGEKASQKAKDLGITKLKVLMKGMGIGKEPAVRSLRSGGIEILSLEDITPVPHNGCRAKKKRRV